MQRLTLDSSAMLANLELMCTLDVTDMAGMIDCPVLLVHSRGDRAVDVNEGRRLAAMLRHAEFVVLDDDNHIFLPGSLGFERACSAIESFLARHTDAGVLPA
jgi:pimeloyl-ACP methyl ester carboxylesterase